MEHIDVPLGVAPVVLTNSPQHLSIKPTMGECAEYLIQTRLVGPNRGKLACYSICTC